MVHPLARLSEARIAFERFHESSLFRRVETEIGIDGREFKLKIESHHDEKKKHRMDKRYKRKETTHLINRTDHHRHEFKPVDLRPVEHSR